MTKKTKKPVVSEETEVVSEVVAEVVSEETEAVVTLKTVSVKKHFQRSVCTAINQHHVMAG